MKEIKSCYAAVFDASVSRMSELVEGDLLRMLLPAVASGDYDLVTKDLAQEFYEAIEVIGEEVVPPYRDLFATLIEKFPGLKEPLRDALDEQNPFKDLLPPNEVPAEEKKNN